MSNVTACSRKHSELHPVSPSATKGADHGPAARWFFGAKDRQTGRLFVADYLEAEDFDRAVELARTNAANEWLRQNPDEALESPSDALARIELTAVSNQSPVGTVDLGFHVAQFLEPSLTTGGD